jgi:hypothetical protein
VALSVAIAERASAAAAAPGREADVQATRYGMVLAALEQLDGNASTQLVMESMLTRMRAV